MIPKLKNQIGETDGDIYIYVVIAEKIREKMQDMDKQIQKGNHWDCGLLESYVLHVKKAATLWPIQFLELYP